jgi:hypothetical protein
MLFIVKEKTNATQMLSAIFFSETSFSLGTPVSSINKIDYHNIAEILFKLALNTITLTLKRASIIITQRYYYLKLVSEKKIAERDAFGQCPVGHSDKQHIDEQQVDLLGGRCPGRFKAWSVPVRISLIFLAHPYVNVCRNREKTADLSLTNFIT